MYVCILYYIYVQYIFERILDRYRHVYINKLLDVVFFWVEKYCVLPSSLEHRNFFVKIIYNYLHQLSKIIYLYFKLICFNII